MTSINKSTTHLFCKSHSTYLLSHSVGRPFQSTEQHISDQLLSPWKEGHPWPQWFTSLDHFKKTLANLLNSTPELFCPQVNLSSALTKIIYSFPFIKTKPVILLSEKDFPSISFVFQKATEKGYQLRFIPKEEDHTDPQVWNKYLQNDVQFVMMTHVHSNTGHLIPLEQIIPIATSRNILSIVDIAQSAGIIPIDLEKLQPDILIGSSIKWLCGGPGAGFLWMKRTLISQAEPVDIGWFSHKNPFEFDVHHFTYSDDASRFMGGTPSVIPYIIAENSIRQLSTMGIDAIRAHNIQLSQMIIEAIKEDYLVSPANPEKRGGTVVLHFGEHQDKVISELTHAGILFDERSTGLRLSFHLYNTEEEVNLVLNHLTKYT